MKSTLLLAIIIATVALVTTKACQSDQPVAEIKIGRDGALKHRYTNPDGTIHCTFETPDEKARRMDCADFDK